MSFDLSTITEHPHLDAEQAAPRLLAAQRRLAHLRLAMAGLLPGTQIGTGVVVVFEGFDAGGKGGAIRRVAEALDPRHVLVRPVGPPTTSELAHHFLWRFQSSMPGRGEMSIFDRSWYGRLLVERVEDLIDEETRARSVDEITNFEASLVNADIAVIKFWMHVSEQEQLRRFEARRNDPLKSWKLTDEDWRNREKRARYITAASEAMAKTDHHGARWHIIAADHKHYARVAVLETLNAQIEKAFERCGAKVPPSKGEDYLD